MALIPLVTTALPAAPAFFGSGGAMLVGCLVLFSQRLRAGGAGAVRRPGGSTWVRLGMRNACRHPGRTTLTAGLIASATFLIVALEAFRLDVDASTRDRGSGTGGFNFYAESAVPLVYDLNTPEGREALVHDEPLLVVAALRVGVTELAQRAHVVRRGRDHALPELDLEDGRVQVADADGTEDRWGESAAI